MSYNKPSQIQQVAIPLIIAHPPKNLIAQSQNGTGKTAAFVISILMRIDRTLKRTQAICLTPSRELARQIATTIQLMTQDTDITSIAILKDIFQPTGPLSTNDILSHQIIVGTPGIILDCLKRRKTIDSKHLKILVLDEADNMLDQDGLGDQSLRIKNMIRSADPQILLFSATFPDHVSKYARRFAPEPNEITVPIEELSVRCIKQCYMDCINEEQKYDVVCSIYDLITVSQSIIFCKLRKTADIISEKMRASGHSVLCMHGNMASEERDERIDDFRRGKYKVLVTTNLISRGIDISQVSLVVNYDMPLDMHGNPDAEVYLHRIGRTGRFGRNGVSVIFVHNEKTYEQMKYLEDHFKVKINRVPTEDWEEAEQVFKQFL
ncbi:P-loop containing nucleoside triphosphate hydrolase protein [Pilaira anomala]|nr:P-loop containing nucleoside triphosphate hydrolase protein [Pilaira anomala]